MTVAIPGYMRCGECKLSYASYTQAFSVVQGSPSSRFCSLCTPNSVPPFDQRDRGEGTFPHKGEWGGPYDRKRHRWCLIPHRSEWLTCTPWESQDTRQCFPRLSQPLCLALTMSCPSRSVSYRHTSFLTVRLARELLPICTAPARVSVPTHSTR